MVGTPFKPKPVAGPAGARGAAPANEGRLTFNVNDPIFNQGDPGGDLFFIEEGTIEIYQEKGQDKTVLSEMSKGEIVGLMTCLTNEPRMASARAKTYVSVKKVPSENIRAVHAALPNWLKIVIKEFTTRLSQANERIADTTTRIKLLEETQVSYLHQAALLSTAIGHLSEGLAIKYEDTKIIVIDDVLQKFEFGLNIPRAELDKIFAVFSDTGLIKVEIEPERKRNVIKLPNAQKLAYFAQFVKETKVGPGKKLLKARFSHKETRVLSALVKLAVALGKPVEQSVELTFKELDELLDRKMSVKFDREALVRAKAFKLLEVKGVSPNEAVVFRPSSLGRTMTCIEAVRRLSEMDRPEVEKAS